MINVPPIPTRAIRIPAKPGPIIRAALKMPELSAIADASASLPTISMTKDCLAGTSIEFTVPRRNARMTISVTVTILSTVRIPRISARHIAADWVKIRIFRFGKRSTRTPPKRENSRLGSIDTAATRPTRNAELVSFNTSHPCATV